MSNRNDPEDNPQLFDQQVQGEVPADPGRLPDETPYDPEIDGPAPQDRPRPEDRGEMLGATGSTAGDNALEKDPSDWVSGDDPMTEAQKSYLDTLAKQAGEQLPANMTKAEASQHIDRLKKLTAK